MVKRGVDPVDEEKKEREAVEAARLAELAAREHTFRAVAERYIAGRTSKRRAKQDAQEIYRLLMPAWGDRPINEIMPDDVLNLIERTAKRSPYDARNCWGHAVGIFKTAVHGWPVVDEETGREVRVRPLAVSPMASLDRKRAFENVDLRHRDRVLSDDEVLAFWRGSGRLGYPYGPWYQLLLLTGVRVSELKGACWSEFHPELRRALRDARAEDREVDWSAMPVEHKVWTVPAERFKSEVDHIVPLQDDALAIIAALPVWDKGDYLFSTTDGRKAVNGFSKAKGRLDREMLKSLRALARSRGEDREAWRVLKLREWVNHDLRRVVRSNLSALNIADHVAEMCLGHGRTGLQRVYDQHRYLDEIRSAMEAWAKRLRRLTGWAPEPQPAGDNVVQMRA
jgi:integrase